MLRGVFTETSLFLEEILPSLGDHANGGLVELMWTQCIDAHFAKGGDALRAPLTFDRNNDTGLSMLRIQLRRGP